MRPEDQVLAPYVCPVCYWTTSHYALLVDPTREMPDCPNHGTDQYPLVPPRGLERPRIVNVSDERDPDEPRER